MTTSNPRSEPVIDVRIVPPFQRHPLIFGTIDALEPGETLVIVADHEPRPLHHQVTAHYADAVSWEYLEQGPAVWRVRIGRDAGPGCR